ncbi:MAG: lysophospholipid acyltransferase family protein [Gemmatimonadales bacterium]
MRRLFGLVIRIFFRRVAVVGGANVPADGPVLFVLNHPNALVDPVLLMALSPRRVVFLAKEPLFRTPVVRWFVQGVGAIPVYRRQDAADMSRNRETFASVWRELQAGGAVAVFPEGTSHSDPALRPLKTGAARIALGASAAGDGGAVQIVPAGLYYTAKSRFRSSAVLCFGAPIAVRPHPVDDGGEPDPDAVRQLTAEIERALGGVTVQAEREKALHLVALAERVFSAAATSGSAPQLADRFDLRQRFMKANDELRQIAPDRVERLERMLDQFNAELDAAGLAPESVPPRRLSPSDVASYALRAVGFLLVTAPVAIVGICTHLPAYLAIGPFVTRALGVERDTTATAKMLAAGLLYPLTWLAASGAVWHWFGAAAAVATLAALPVTGYIALLFAERFDRLVGAARGLGLRVFRRRAWLRLEARRRRIRAAIEELAALRPAH